MKVTELRKCGYQDRPIVYRVYSILRHSCLSTNTGISRADNQGVHVSAIVNANPLDWDWCKSWFSAELFWVRHAMCRTMMPALFRGSFASNGKWVYEQHVAMVRGLRLPKHRLLEWSVEDGWEPLCRFLGRDIPQMQFPNGNPPQAWTERIARTTAAYHARAVRNMRLFGAVVVVNFSLVAKVWVCRV